MENRGCGQGRRLRDRLAEREGTRNPRLRRYELQDLVLFLDDDLRETALAIGGIESFLGEALALLEREDVARGQIAALAGDQAVADRLELLEKTMTSLRRRMARLAEALEP